MSSLTEVIRDHAPVLVVDTASLRVQVGLCQADGRNRWITRTDEPSAALFAGLAELGVDLNTVGAFVFCDGPGSVLGIRSAAMAIRVWQTLRPRPAFAYSSLALVATALGRAEITMIADARRDTWHCQQLGGVRFRQPTSGLAGELVTPENFRSWSVPPAAVATTPYMIPDLWATTANKDLLRATEAPDAFLAEEPNFVPWKAHIHRAPG